MEVKDDYFLPKNWQIIDETYAFLKPFYEVIIMNQGDFLLIDQTLYIIDILIKHFKRLKISFLEAIKALLIGNINNI